MRAGQKRCYITIKTKAAGVDSYGQPNGATSTTYTVWASIRPLSGSELFAAQQISSVVTTEIRFDYQDAPAVTPKHWVEFGTRKFDINTVVNRDSQNKELILYCKENI